MPIPTYFKSPFIKTTDIVFRRVDIYERINMNDLIIVPFRHINIKKSYINKKKIVSADTRYPGIVYRSKLNPLVDESVTKNYCIFDGTHRLLNMIQEGLTANVFYLLTPKHFEGLTEYPLHFTQTRLRIPGCGGCME